MSHEPDQNSESDNPPNFETLKNRMNLELESISANQLHNLASQAVERKLISAHGHRGGRYELLRDGEFILLSPTEALQYLQDLLQDTEA
ncbi:MAG: hypothetical protein AAFV72_18380 [Cyanobacteria bacterium J06635_1]